MADESVMSQKAHGTSEKPVMKDLRWNCDYETADRICNFNRHYAEYAGYWQTTEFPKSIDKEEKPIKFYDSVTGKLLFTAPIGRSMDDFLKESKAHGWPSFRDAEVRKSIGAVAFRGSPGDSYPECLFLTAGELGLRSMLAGRGMYF